GFRPAGAEPTLRDYDRGPNPFTRLRRHGVILEPEIDEFERAEGSTLTLLIELWGDATGR
ncbi:MAG: hypothetical protein KC457_17670, partial [Myxococcales bacterium]|nr:hypothetical protein [Myxococcales bacterium]